MPGVLEQRRCFAHVRDVVGALIALAEHPAAVGEVYNVGSDEETSILALAERIRTATGSGSEIRLVPYDEAYEEGFEDMERRLPDLSKVHALLGYRPRFDLDAILRDVVAYETGRRPRPDLPAAVCEAHP